MTYNVFGWTLNLAQSNPHIPFSDEYCFIAHIAVRETQEVSLSSLVEM